ncbi:Panacea domain-containing protein [Clostridium tertium]|jgi:uncharacterized phage-associated protein|uniref:Panacea domain-containing protein n=1 Tax=Clostridium tertium TaxID=1559 RepID=UPI00332D7037
MYHHMILICSDFTSGKRIAFYKTYKDVLSSIEFKKYIEYFKGKYEELKLSFHHIATESNECISIGDYDNYFYDVKFYSDIEEFEKHISESMKITPEDIAKYILLEGKFDKLQLQKLVFLVYSEYALRYGKALFEEEFEAWKYGPVMPRLYYELDGYKKEKIEFKDIDLEKIKLKLKLSKVVNVEDILSCIDSIVSKYGSKKGGELIDITHKEGSPWQVTESEKGLNSVIPFELIKEYELI